MILTAFFRALGQLGDRRFRRVVLLGVLLALALLVAVYALFLQVIWWLTPDSVELPVIGPVTGIDTLLGWTSLFFMVGLSVFLMVPVAAAFAGLYLEDVVDAVEDRHYPFLPAPTPQPWAEAMRQALNHAGLVIGLNVVAVFLYPLVGLASPLLFWGLNGFLLGREYFAQVAARRLPRDEVKAMRRRNFWTVWGAGALMALPLSLPFVNLVIPVLGVASFTHVFHRLAAAGR